MPMSFQVQEVLSYARLPIIEEKGRNLAFEKGTGTLQRKILFRQCKRRSESAVENRHFW